MKKLIPLAIVMAGLVATLNAADTAPPKVVIAPKPAPKPDPAAVAKAKAKAKVEVEVALALAATSTDCGHCAHDEQESRLQAVLQRKPLVLVVGGCDGKGEAAFKVGAVACVVPTYDGDAKPRVVVLIPKGDGWAVFPPLPPDVGADAMKKAVKDAADAIAAEKLPEPATKGNPAEYHI